MENYYNYKYVDVKDNGKFTNDISMIGAKSLGNGKYSFEEPEEDDHESLAKLVAQRRAQCIANGDYQGGNY